MCGGHGRGEDASQLGARAPGGENSTTNTQLPNEPQRIL